MIVEVSPADVNIEHPGSDLNQILLTSYLDCPAPTAQILRDSQGHLAVYHPDTGFNFHNPKGQNLAEWAAWLLEHKIALLAGELNSHFALLKAMGELPGGEQLGCRFEIQQFGSMTSPMVPVSGVQQATLDDLARLTDFYQRSEDMQRSRENLEQRLTENLVVFCEREGQIVSAALTHRHNREAALIGGVYTVPDYRGKNLGRDCVQTLCALLQGQNKIPCLFYEQNNQAAAALYKKLNFAPLGAWIIIEVVYDSTVA